MQILTKLTLRIISYFALTLCFAIVAVITSPAIANSAETCLKSIGNSLTSTGKKTSKNEDVKIEFITHSTFRITSPNGLIIETDYTGKSSHNTITNTGPNIITLNHTSTNKLVRQLSNKTTNVLAPWSDETQKSKQLILVKNDVSIRNFQTDIYENGTLKTPKKNSIFLFKIAGLCIAHLGKIQHPLNDKQIAAIGNIDIVMTPVSGRDQFATTLLAKTLIGLNAKIIIPMHWQNDTDKQNFMADLSSSFSIAGYPTNALIVSTKTLPKSPTIVTMIPQYAQNEAEYSKHH